MRSTTKSPTLADRPARQQSEHIFGAGVTLHQTNHGSNLAFTVTRHRSSFAIALTAFFAFAALASFWRREALDLPLELALVALFTTYSRLREHKTTLRVTADGLTATGNLGGLREGTLYLPWSKVRELHFLPPAHHEPGGLYAREGSWCSRCILPRLSEAQADQIIAAIALDHRIEIRHPTPHSS